MKNLCFSNLDSLPCTTTATKYLIVTRKILFLIFLLLATQLNPHHKSFVFGGNSFMASFFTPAESAMSLNTLDYVEFHAQNYKIWLLQVHKVFRKPFFIPQNKRLKLFSLTKFSMYQVRTWDQIIKFYPNIYEKQDKIYF